MENIVQDFLNGICCNPAVVYNFDVTSSNPTMWQDNLGISDAESFANWLWEKMGFEAGGPKPIVTDFNLVNGRLFANVTGAKNLILKGNLDNTYITNVDALPDDLVVIDFTKNYIQTLPILPSHLLELSISYNKLISIPLLPDSLIKLDISCQGHDGSIYSSLSSIENIVSFPPNIQFLNLRDNNLLNTYLPLPESVNHFDILNCNYTTAQMDDFARDFLIGTPPNKLWFYSGSQLTYEVVSPEFQDLLYQNTNNVYF